MQSKFWGKPQEHQDLKGSYNTDLEITAKEGEGENSPEVKGKACLDKEDMPKFKDAFSF